MEEFERQFYIYLHRCDSTRVLVRILINLKLLKQHKLLNVPLFVDRVTNRSKYEE